jgi:hypothetical protein
MNNFKPQVKIIVVLLFIIIIKPEDAAGFSQPFLSYRELQWEPAG